MSGSLLTLWVANPSLQAYLKTNAFLLFGRRACWCCQIAPLSIYLAPWMTSFWLAYLCINIVRSGNISQYYQCWYRERLVNLLCLHFWLGGMLGDIIFAQLACPLNEVIFFFFFFLVSAGLNHWLRQRVWKDYTLSAGGRGIGASRTWNSLKGLPSK